MVVAILGGKRPQLTQRTIDSVLDKCPELFESNKVIFFNNANDKATRDLVESYDFIDKLIVRKKTVSIGRAMSILAEEVKKSGEELYLLLENDWLCTNSGWLEQAQRLARNSRISQVRLRLDSERVLPNHMITGEPIKWRTKSGFKIADKAHFTQNPSIIKVSDIDNIFPATGERKAQKNWLENGMGKVVQLTPGAFQHIGEGQSLREVTQCEL